MSDTTRAEGNGAHRPVPVRLVYRGVRQPAEAEECLLFGYLRRGVCLRRDEECGWEWSIDIGGFDAFVWEQIRLAVDGDRFFNPKDLEALLRGGSGGEIPYWTLPTLEDLKDYKTPVTPGIGESKRER